MIQPITVINNRIYFTVWCLSQRPTNSRNHSLLFVTQPSGQVTMSVSPSGTGWKSETKTFQNKLSQAVHWPLPGLCHVHNGW